MFSQNVEGIVIKLALYQALKYIAPGKLTVDERDVLRVDLQTHSVDPQIWGKNVTKFAIKKAPPKNAQGKKTFDERVVFRVDPQTHCVDPNTRVPCPS